MQISVTLLEGLILLVLSGIGAVAWWGVKRFIKLNDDSVIAMKRMHDTNTDTLNKIYKNLGIMCERLGKSDTWMELHSKQDDERHEQVKDMHEQIQSSIRNRDVRE